VLYANTDDGSSALWVLDGNGVVVDNISYSIADRAPILAQINEHYGTSFTGWADNEIGLRVGDSLPDWNAYEKIENHGPYDFKIQYNGYYIVGNGIKDDYAEIWGKDMENAWLVNSNGQIIGSVNVDDIYSNLLDVLFTDFDIIEKYELNDTIPDFSQFIVLTL
jgi:hypothetical protein